MLTTVKASVAVSLLALLAACSDRAVTAPQNAALNPSASVVADRSTESRQQEVTGHAYYLVTPERNAVEEYSVSAIRHKDGHFSGEVEIESAINNGFRIHGEIACFTTVGNMARLSARVTQSTNRNVVPGAYLFWSFIDNGERKGDAPDMSSQFFLADQSLALYHCATGVTIPEYYVVLHGNLQVH